MKRGLYTVLVIGFFILCAGAVITPYSKLNSAEVVIPAPVVSTPVELIIESIAMHAAIEQVGLLGGSMAVPVFPDDVGWYDFGTIPGEIGSAVMAGHVNWHGGQNAVFTHLKNVQVGDTITVIDSNSTKINFMVRDIKSYPVDGNTSEVFSSSDGLAHLNLITCSGIWNELLGTHEERLVVFSERV